MPRNSDTGDASSCLLETARLMRRWASLSLSNWFSTYLRALKALMMRDPEMASSKWLSILPIRVWVSTASLRSFPVILLMTMADRGSATNETIVSFGDIKNRAARKPITSRGSLKKMWKLPAMVFCTSLTSLEILERMSPLRRLLKYPRSRLAIFLNRSALRPYISLVFMLTSIL